VHKFSIKALGLVLLATLIGVIAMPSPSFADSTPGTRTLPVSWQFLGGDQLAVVELDSAWQLGDCTLTLGNKVTLNLTQRRLIWDGAGTTAKTHNGDIWHSTFIFRNGADNTTVSVSDLDSPKMFPRPDGGVDLWTDIKTGIGIPRNFTPFTMVWNSAC
jgi:hypothetical protein